MDGGSLWPRVVEAWLDDDDVPISRVVATLKPDIPPPSPAPGGVFLSTCHSSIRRTFFFKKALNTVEAYIRAVCGVCCGHQTFW